MSQSTIGLLYLEHFSSVETSDKFPCLVCKIDFTLKGNLARHLRLKHGPTKGKFACKFCHKRFSRSDSTTRHETNCPKNVQKSSKAIGLSREDNNNSAQTSKDVYHLPKKGRLVIFNKKKSKSNGNSVNQDRHKCKTCRKSFRQKNNLSRHYRMVHSAQDKPKCKYCQKPFSRVDAVRRHETGCSNGRIESKQTGNNFSQGTIMSSERIRSSDIPMKTTNGIAPTTAHTCQMPSQDHRQRHWRPWEDKPNSREIFGLKCERSNCSAEFKRESELRRHRMSKHHKKRKICKICRKVFTRRDNLTRHMKLAHVGDKKPRCKYCFKILSRRDAVQRHESTCPKNPAKKFGNYTKDSLNESYPSHLERIGMKLEKINGSIQSKRRAESQTDTDNEIL